MTVFAVNHYDHDHDHDPSTPILHHAPLIPAGMNPFHWNPEESAGMELEWTGMDRNGTGMDLNGHFGAKGTTKTLFQWTRQAISTKLYRYCPNLQNYLLLSSFPAIFTFI